MPISLALEAPTAVVIDSVPVTFPASQTLRGLDILGPGELEFTDIEDNALEYDFSGLTVGVPYRFTMQIKSITSWSGSAALVGLH